jgi:hypothetical protein
MTGSSPANAERCSETKTLAKSDAVPSEATRPPFIRGIFALMMVLCGAMLGGGSVLGLCRLELCRLLLL